MVKESEITEEMSRGRLQCLAEKKDYRELQELFKHYIDSFDYMVDRGLNLMLLNIKPVEIFNSSSRLKISFGKSEVGYPVIRVPSHLIAREIYPFECRESNLTYDANLWVDINIQLNDEAVVKKQQCFGKLPIMLMSKRCHLTENPKKLIKHKEDPSGIGGYFIVNGLERVTQLITVQKRNYPMSMVGNSFRKREGYNDKAVVHYHKAVVHKTSGKVTLYYLDNGSARLGFNIKRNEYVLPVGIILKALTEATDVQIYASLTGCYDENDSGKKGSVGTQLFRERAVIILDELKSLSLFNRTMCLEHIGKQFQTLMTGLEGKNYSFVANVVLKEYIFVHLDDDLDKYNLLIFMLQKLFSLVDETSLPDNPDALQNQEVLLPGHLISVYLQEKFEGWLLRVKRRLQNKVDTKKDNFELLRVEDVRRAIAEETNLKFICSCLENMLKTGNLRTTSTLDIKQRAGMTVQADRRNFLSFLSHFRAVHRGESSRGLDTTTSRQLLPESWGFLCPVHTPPGESCGLLEHMTSSCRITSYYDSKGIAKDFVRVRKTILQVLRGSGMTPSSSKLVQSGPPEVLSVLLDGCIVGWIPSGDIEKVVSHLRGLKVSGKSVGRHGAKYVIPEDLEVGYVPLNMVGAYPGLYLSTSASRFVRPVWNISIPLGKNNIELIGPFEQVHMEISCPDGGNGGRTGCFPATHTEIHPTGILSVVANLTPWSDHNPVLQNINQCQIAKKTMGFSCQAAINTRANQKLYHLQTPQTPIVRTKTYEKYHIDDHPQGTNAIVAVISYTGYDMNDAIVLNKSSVDRGMFHGSIYQMETIELQKKKSDQTRRSFGRGNLGKSSHLTIDSDGLPFVGQRIKPNDPYCSIYTASTSKATIHKYSGSEPVFVDSVSVHRDSSTKRHIKAANIRFRHPRNPKVGDKFSSRHGQKGACELFPDIDMPFSGVTGMRPDLLINPHAFPCKSTIGMLLESVAAKGGALNGEFIDATPFSSSVKKNADGSGSLHDQLGSMLIKRGFNYYGLEVLYSGFYGTELRCEIFVGPVYYQRLRHMVYDKFKVRTTGPVDPVTRQPTGKNHAAPIHFGEMERDSLLAHGAAYLLHDRLHTCSDYHIADVCSLCGSLLTTTLIQPPDREIHRLSGIGPSRVRVPPKATCVHCQTGKGMEKVAMPYAFRYLAAELACMNVRMVLRLSEDL